jgi:hypothetical protein
MVIINRKHAMKLKVTSTIANLLSSLFSLAASRCPSENFMPQTFTRLAGPQTQEYAKTWEQTVSKTPSQIEFKRILGVTIIAKAFTG